MHGTLLLQRMAAANTRLEKQLSADAVAELDADWAELIATPSAAWDRDVLRRLLLRGPPDDAQRGAFWAASPLMFPAGDRVPETTRYVDLLSKPCIYQHAIAIDLSRTFPDDPLFADGGDGQGRCGRWCRCGRYGGRHGCCRCGRTARVGADGEDG